MAMTLGELAALVKGEVVGNPALRILGACSAAGAAPDRITFAESPAALAAALASPAGAVIVGRKAEAAGKALLRADHPRLAFVAILEALHPERRPPPGVHHTAFVDRSASLGEGISVGPHAVIDAEAVVGDGCCVGAGCVVGPGARLGPGCRLYPRVVLYAGVMLGARVIIHSGAVLGSDGFGYVETPGGRRKFPQVGLLVVEDDVEIGANTTIDRGALDATLIRAGTKIDNLVQIAHNVEIGRDCAISAQTGIAGTSRIGDWVTLAGQVGIGDHVTIESRAIVAAQAGVPTGKNLQGGEVYWGTPARPLSEVKERHVDVARIPRLVEHVKELEARVKALEGRGA